MSLGVEIAHDSRFVLFKMGVLEGRSYLSPFAFPGQSREIDSEIAAFTKVSHQESTDDTGLVGVDGSRFAIPAEEAFGCGYEAHILEHLPGGCGGKVNGFLVKNGQHVDVGDGITYFGT